MSGRHSPRFCRRLFIRDDGPMPPTSSITPTAQTPAREEGSARDSASHRHDTQQAGQGGRGAPRGRTGNGGGEAAHRSAKRAEALHRPSGAKRRVDEAALEQPVRSSRRRCARQTNSLQTHPTTQASKAPTIAPWRMTIENDHTGGSSIISSGSSVSPGTRTIGLSVR